MWSNSQRREPTAHKFTRLGLILAGPRTTPPAPPAPVRAGVGKLRNVCNVRNPSHPTLIKPVRRRQLPRKPLGRFAHVRSWTWVFLSPTHLNAGGPGRQEERLAELCGWDKVDLCVGGRGRGCRNYGMAQVSGLYVSLNPQFGCGRCVEEKQPAPPG